MKVICNSQGLISTHSCCYMKTHCHLELFFHALIYFTNYFKCHFLLGLSQNTTLNLKIGKLIKYYYILKTMAI